jgi:hypothetical protein
MKKFAVWSWDEKGVLVTAKVQAETATEAMAKSDLAKDIEDLRAVKTVSPVAEFASILGNRWEDGKKHEVMVGWVIWDTSVVGRN